MSDWPDQLPGLDIKKALSQLGGKKKLYNRLLVMFNESHTNDVQNIEQAFVAQNWQELQELNHALKGVVGNLAAKDLYELCSSIDSKLKAGDQEIGAEIAAMKDAMIITASSMQEAAQFPTDE